MTLIGQPLAITGNFSSFVIVKNEMTKQSFTTLFENCFRRKDCFGAD